MRLSVHVFMRAMKASKRRRCRGSMQYRNSRIGTVSEQINSHGTAEHTEQVQHKRMQIRSCAKCRDDMKASWQDEEYAIAWPRIAVTRGQTPPNKPDIK